MLAECDVGNMRAAAASMGCLKALAKGNGIKDVKTARLRCRSSFHGKTPEDFLIHKGWHNGEKAGLSDNPLGMLYLASTQINVSLLEKCQYTCPGLACRQPFQVKAGRLNPTHTPFEDCRFPAIGKYDCRGQTLLGVE